MNIKHPLTATLLLLLCGCTTGELYYTKDTGERVLACEVEFTGLPSVDKHAVDYALSLCAKNAVKKGFTVDLEQTYLVTLDTSIPSAPCNQAWDHKIAKAQYRDGLLSKKEYGYIVAHIDLGLAQVNECNVSVSYYTGEAR